MFYSIIVSSHVSRDHVNAFTSAGHVNAFTSEVSGLGASGRKPPHDELCWVNLLASRVRSATVSSCVAVNSERPLAVVSFV